MLPQAFHLVHAGHSGADTSLLAMSSKVCAADQVHQMTSDAGVMAAAAWVYHTRMEFLVFWFSVYRANFVPIQQAGAGAVSARPLKRPYVGMITNHMLMHQEDGTPAH